ncbi:glycosyltransferase family 2 protein [Butyrivibrio sp. JL13D10]|uniref:glycosyltransferase family 2 protein n=1 Tax=Butyrivibrio sp. JL13D10 TaxID=3236815 RepID=UPI0038B4D224
MDKISIIVPVYNVEKYLKRCVESLINQTFTNLEILLIDDGSKDSSGRLCDELALLDDRIKVFHKENGGLSDARNYGIERAQGDFLCFVDSDDYIASEYCSLMHKIALDENADIVMCGVKRFSGDIYVGSDLGTNEYKMIKSSDALREMYSDEGEKYTIATNKLYRRSVIGTIRYPIGRINEDEYTTYKFFLNVDQVVILEKKLYFYFYNNNSITTNEKYYKNLDIYDAFEERIRLFEEHGNLDEQIVLTYKAYMDRIIFRYNRISNDDNARKKLIKLYRNKYEKVNKKIKKIGYTIYYYSPSIYYLLLNIKKRMEAKKQ